MPIFPGDFFGASDRNRNLEYKCPPDPIRVRPLVSINCILNIGMNPLFSNRVVVQIVYSTIKTSVRVTV